MKFSSVCFALGAASPLGVLRFECASLWVGLRPLVFGDGRVLNEVVGVL